MYGIYATNGFNADAQRPTPNAQRSRRIRTSTWKIDCLNSAHGLFDWLMLSRIRGRLIMLPAKFSVAGLLHMESR